MSKWAITRASSSSAVLRQAQDDTRSHRHCSGPLSSARGRSIPHDDNSYFMACALEYRADRLDVANIVGFFSRRFQNGGFVAQFGPSCQRAETVETDVAFADVMMAVAVSAQRHF